ncbi:hypothetical protein IP88_05055 [alpha proteobacterium AAP81b]|nr:hypothetical protein IP88_05055 [alpha proteobacterium AAP81b]
MDQLPFAPRDSADDDAPDVGAGGTAAWAPVPPPPAPPRWRPHWSFTAFVAVPALLAALYFLVIAANQYESEAVFVVRGVQPPRATSSLVDLIGAPGLTPGAAETRGVGEYLLSHDAVRALGGRGIDLVAMFRRPEADVVSRLWFERPRAETLLRYYRGQVALAYDPDAGMTRMTVRAFRPEDAEALAAALLTLGEARVNQFNDRALAAVGTAASREVVAAEAELADIQRQLTRFRTRRGDIDPGRNAAGTQGLVGEIEARLAAARADAAAMARVLSPSSPQLIAMRGRIAGLEGQRAAAAARLTGQGSALAPRLADYEELQLRQQFAAKRYEAARATREAARAEALREQLFVVPVVTPNRPEKSLYPRRWLTVLAIWAGLVVAWGIGWLLVAGFREHAD